MVTHPKTGEIWEHEHGPKGGDEINIIKPGINYGWPTITYGINYSGTPITDKTSMPNMAQPYYYWVPSIGPSGMAFSSSGVYPDWTDNLFAGSLKFEYLERLVIENNKVVKREKVLDKIGRVRNVVEGQGMSYEEMAEAMKVSKGTIMSRLSHARQKLQRSLAECYEEQFGGSPQRRKASGGKA
mgnify:CR=1 FL=1